MTIFTRPSRKLILALALPLVLSSALALAANKPAPRAALPPPDAKTVQAVRTAEPITLDGRLDEAVWKAAPPAIGFTQNDPEDGSPATEPTEVWVAYDDHALYVAAFCRDSDPAKIRKRLGRRDTQTDSDWFMVAVDPYFDKRSGYAFYANPAGSITDAALSNDVNDDDTWDGVWETKAAVTEAGWTVEIRVPFNQIRFPKKDEYVWGVNFKRMLRRKNEQSTFNWSPKSEAAYVSRFARLEGLRGISPGGRVELMPYAVTQAELSPEEPGNPFATGHETLGSAGFDLKAGLKSNLTLDATVNPDFGQVEVDPAVLNLSAYETYYEEKRPFFIEGASLFNNFGRGGVFINANINWPQPQFFYSRRIGREPQGYVTEPGYSTAPDRTTILGAAKLTGQLGGSWNVGFLNAVTAREYAQIDQGGVRLEQEVEPLTYYGALRIQKDIDEGRHGIGFMATGVARDLEGSGTNETLDEFLNKNAFTLAVDGWTSLDKKKDWVIGGWAGATRVGGSVEDILQLQNSPTHYFQRPDATHVEVDPTATSLSGWAGRINLAKQNGNLLVLANIGAISPGFNPNDTGFQRGGSDIINMQFLPGYQWTKPGKMFLYALVIGGWFRNYDFGGNKNWDGGLVEFQGRLQELLDVRRHVRVQPRYDVEEPDPGRAAGGRAVGVPVQRDGGDGQPQAGRVRVPGDDVPAAAGGDGVGGRGLGPVEAGLELQPGDRADARDRAERHPVGDADAGPGHGGDVRGALRVRADRPAGDRQRDPVRLDVHAEADASGLPAAVHRGRALRHVQGAGRAVGVPIQRVRGRGVRGRCGRGRERVDDRLRRGEPHVHGRPGRGGGRGGAVLVREPGLQLQVAAGDGGAEVGVPAGQPALFRLDAEPGGLRQSRATCSCGATWATCSPPPATTSSC